MAFAYIHEFDVGADRSTTNYDAIGAKLRLDEAPAEGLILHAAGFAGDKFRMVEIWESAELQQRYERERLMPTVREVAGENGTPPATTSYELHNLIAG
jgi:hypothetical protein